MNKNLQELKVKSKKEPIATPQETDTLSAKINEIKKGNGYAIIVGPQKPTFAGVMQPKYAENMYQKTYEMSQFLSKEVDKSVTMITDGFVPEVDTECISPSLLGAYVTGLSTISDLEKSYIKLCNQKLYVANPIVNASFEEAVSHEGYNYSAHMNVIESNQESLISGNRKNPTAILVNVDTDVKHLQDVLKKNKPEVFIFQMNIHSTEKLGTLLEVVTSQDNESAIFCEPVELGCVEDAKVVISEFVETCHENELYPSGFKIALNENKNDLSSQIIQVIAESLKHVKKERIAYS